MEEIKNTNGRETDWVNNVNTEGRELEWDDAIENDSTFELLPEGDYEFVVAGLERARHPGSDKLPPCRKAIMSIDIIDTVNFRTVTIRHNFYLHTKCEGMLCSFFTAIGQRKHGEQYKMNWTGIIGAMGKCKVGIRTWKGKDGEEKKSNEIKKFYEPDITPTPAAAPMPTYQAGVF